MKAIGLLVIQVLAVLGTKVAAVWILIEFILYLAKDDKFNWMSVWIFIALCIVAIANAIVSAVYTAKEENRALAKLKERRATTKKSKWQERLEKLAEERANTKA